MIVVGIPRGRNVVSPAVRRANAAKQAARESTAQNLRGNFERRIIFVAEYAAQVSNLKKGLRSIVFGCQVYTSGRFLDHLRKRRNRRLCVLPVGEETLKFALHLGG